MLAIANAGACTAWLMRGGRAVELVSPRTFGRLCDPFSTDVPAHWQAPLISLGTSEELEPEIFEYRLREGDWLIMHTDGVLSADRRAIAEVQARNGDPERAAEEVMQILTRAEPEDNASATLVIF
jgi:serine/threonine protein phosphatase PrpC